MSKFAAKKKELVVDSGKTEKPELIKKAEKADKARKAESAKEPKEAPAAEKKTKKKEIDFGGTVVKKAPKAKTEKSDTAEKGPDNRKLKLLTKDNPKREGTKAHERFELYRNAKTVQAFLDAGGTLGDVKYDSEKGYIEVA